MADEKFYEQKLTKAFAEAYVAADSARKYVKAFQDMQGAKAAVCLRMSQLIHISTSDAEAYIDLRTGKFRPGRYMSYCLDEKLKAAFARLEPIMLEYRKYTFSSQMVAANISNQKLEQVKQIIAEIKRIFGEQKAKVFIDNARAAAQKQTGIYS